MPNASDVKHSILYLWKTRTNITFIAPVSRLPGGGVFHTTALIVTYNNSVRPYENVGLEKNWRLISFQKPGRQAFLYHIK